MSVHASSGASAPWQILAELRAARAGSPDPGSGADASAASASDSSPSGSASSAASGTPPQPPPGLLQFLQQFQSGFGTTDPVSDTTAADPSPTGTSTTTTGTTDSSSPGSDIAKILADLQSLFTQLQQGLSGSPQASVATTATGTTPNGTTPNGTTTNGTTTEAGTTQTGNDLALQFLNGFQNTLQLA